MLSSSWRGYRPPRRLVARIRASPIAAAITAKYPPGALVRPRWYIPAPVDLPVTWLRGIDDADLALA